MRSAENVEAVDFGHKEEPKQELLDIDEALKIDGVRHVLLPDEFHEYIETQAEIDGISDDELILKALKSYKFMREQIDTGRTHFVIAEDGQLHKVTWDDFELPPAS